MTGVSNEIDPGRCPLCRGDNRCAAQAQQRTGQAQPPCWCRQVSFDAALRARVPPEARGRACICRACAEGVGV